MGLAFENDLHDQFGTWPAAYIPYGGADLGEILAVGRAVGNGDDAAFHDAWLEAGDRLAAEGAEAERRGLRSSAQELYLRASAFYATSYHLLYGAPTDPCLVAAFRKQIAAFDKGLALSGVPVAAMRIPFEGTSMPAYLVPAVGREREARPLIILTNGYDATVTDTITSPTLMTLAEADPLAAGTQSFFDALGCPKTLMRFSSAEGAGEHCEMGNRSLLNRRVLDWLDDVLGR